MFFFLGGLEDFFKIFQEALSVCRTNMFFFQDYFLIEQIIIFQEAQVLEQLLVSSPIELCFSEQEKEIILGGDLQLVFFSVNSSIQSIKI